MRKKVFSKAVLIMTVMVALLMAACDISISILCATSAVLFSITRCRYVSSVSCCAMAPVSAANNNRTVIAYLLILFFFS
jgi:hypothetical protein